MSLTGWVGKINFSFLVSFAAVVGAAVLSRGGQTLLAFVLARTLGVHGYGEFVFAVGAAVLAGMLADFGWPNVLNREMPRLIRQGSWGLLRGLIRAADVSVILFGLASAAALLIGAEFWPHLAGSLIIAALMVVPIALVLMRQQQLAALHRPATGMLLDQGMAATLLLLIHLFCPIDTEATLLTYAALILLLVLIGSWIFYRQLPGEARAARPVYRMREWLVSGGAMFSSTLPRILVTRFDVLLVAPLAGLVEAGLFGAALRVTLLMTFPQFILQILVMPRFSRAFAHNEVAQVRRLIILSVIFVVVTATPFLAFMVLAPEWVMSTLFGADFRQGGAALFWLSIGQLAAAFGIPLNVMIAMGGNHKAMGLQGLVVLVVTFICGFIFVPTYGAEGAAILTAVANIALLIGLIWLARPLT